MKDKLKYGFLIDHMTLEEKASLMSGADFWHTKPVERVGVPSAMMSDGPHGLRKMTGALAVTGLGRTVPATCYPTAAGLANTWDDALLEEMGAHIGREANAEGISMVLGPGVNIKRSPLCGRNFEYFSEDPLLAGKMAAALIRGIQSQGVYACVKHFAVNSQELRRMTVDSVVDERTLREIYLPAFELAVKEGGVKGLMTSYNRVNGVYASENEHLLRDILYNEWGYKGLVVSDWGANNDRVAAVKAGLTLEMPTCGSITDGHIVAAVREGRLDEALLDEQVDRLLQFVFSTADAAGSGADYDRAQHHLFAQRVAEECAVLLKNDGGILPIRGREKTVALIGAFAAEPRYQGAGSSRIVPTLMDTAVQSLPLCSMNIKGYAKGFDIDGRADEKLTAEAAALAESADIALLYLGLPDSGEMEGEDRADMLLPENQIELLKAIAAVNENIVVVLSCGCAVEMQWHRYAKAVVHGYLGGQAGAMAMARLLTGQVNFSGKLAETVPLSLAAVPSSPYFPGMEATAEHREGIYVGYRYYETAKVPAMYPFGFGLSYTTFEYSGLRVEGGSVRFSVKNTGDMAGAEIAQLYIAPHTHGMFRPAKELRGFARITLAPGEEREVEITLTERSFAVWNTAEERWTVEPGEYEILIGASVTDIRLSARIEKAGEAAPNPYVGALFEPYYNCDVFRIRRENFEALLGRRSPNAKWRRSAKLGMNDNICQGDYLKRGLGRPFYRSMTAVQGALRAVGAWKAAGDFGFLVNMPYRALGRMSGTLDDGQLDAVLKLVNGEAGGGEEFAAATKRRILKKISK